MTPLRPHAAWLLAVALACTRARAPGSPAPLAVNPPRAPSDAPVRVEITGRDFDPAVRADFDGGAGGVDAQFQARLEPSGAGSAVPLAGVTFTERHSLVATVPAGVAPGSYRLVVVDPGGRSGALEHAYRVVAPAGSIARFDVALASAPKAGVAFPVVVTALDAGGAVVDGFEGTVTLSDTAGALAPSRPAAFVRGRGRAKVKIKRLVDGDALTVSDGAGHTGTSPPFSVRAGPPMALVFVSDPVVVAAGDCSPAIELALRDGTGTPAVADTALAVALQSAPPGLGTYANAGCTRAISTIEIAAGDGSATFHVRAAAPGPVTVRALPATLPSARQTQTVTP